MAEVVAVERDPQLRILAVRQLGMMGGKAGTDALVNLYAKETDTQVRRAAIQALSFQPGNADALVAMARKEANPELRRELVRVLSFMGSPAAIEYLQEILEK
jgi:HEAT repeat protein